MVAKLSLIDRAYARIAILKAIVRAERERAEGNPLDERNVNFGVIEKGLTKDKAIAQITDRFNDIEIFLDHLHVAHIAAAFEAAALGRLATVIGESRKAVKSARKGKSPWPQDLVRDAETFKGLHNLGQILSLDTETQTTFNIIKSCRNDLSHGEFKESLPAVTSGDTYATLSEVLSLLL